MGPSRWHVRDSQRAVRVYSTSMATSSAHISFQCDQQFLSKWPIRDLIGKPSWYGSWQCLQRVCRSRVGCLPTYYKPDRTGGWPVVADDSRSVVGDSFGSLSQSRRRRTIEACWRASPTTWINWT
jgi:hypothetical protein